MPQKKLNECHERRDNHDERRYSNFRRYKVSQQRDYNVAANQHEHGRSPHSNAVNRRRCYE